MKLYIGSATTSNKMQIRMAFVPLHKITICFQIKNSSLNINFCKNDSNTSDFFQLLDIDE